MICCRKYYVLILIAPLLAMLSCAGNPGPLKSPNGKIEVRFGMEWNL